MATAERTICGDCRAENLPGRRVCWLCHKPIPPPLPPLGTPLSLGGTSELVPALEVPPGLPVGSRPRFTLNSLMLLVTLVAVCFGVFRVAPGLAILLLIVVAPALFRTFVSGARRKQRGEQVSIGDKVLAFAGSLGIMLLIAMAAGVSFFTTCWVACAGVAIVGNDGNSAFQAGLMIGLLVALALSIGLFVLFLPRRN